MTREAVGAWTPTTWPAIGDRFYLPHSDSYGEVLVVEVHPPTHIVVTVDGGPIRIGRPDVVMIEGLRERVWNFYELEECWSPT